jgi:hypothetical protein
MGPDRGIQLSATATTELTVQIDRSGTVVVMSAINWRTEGYGGGLY